MVREEVRDGYWYVEVDALRASRELSDRLRAHAAYGSGLWRKVTELPTTTSPILRGVFYPLRPEDV